MSEQLQHDRRQHSAMNSGVAYYISGILLAVWFVAFVLFNFPAEIHLVFLVAVLVMVYQLVRDYNNRH